MTGVCSIQDHGSLACEDVGLIHKTVEDYFEALQQAGFTRLPRLRELRVAPEILRIGPALFAPLGDTPLHLALAVER